MKIQIQIIYLTICIGIANNYAIANPEQYAINALELAATLNPEPDKSKTDEERFQELNKKETIKNAQTHELKEIYKELIHLKTKLKREFSDELKQALSDAKLSFDHLRIAVHPDDLPTPKGKVPTPSPSGKKLPPPPPPAPKQKGTESLPTLTPEEKEQLKKAQEEKFDQNLFNFLSNKTMDTLSDKDIADLERLSKKLKKDLPANAKWAKRRKGIKGEEVVDSDDEDIPTAKPLPKPKAKFNIPKKSNLDDEDDVTEKPKAGTQPPKILSNEDDW